MYCTVGTGWNFSTTDAHFVKEKTMVEFSLGTPDIHSYMYVYIFSRVYGVGLVFCGTGVLFHAGTVADSAIPCQGGSCSWGCGCSCFVAADVVCGVCGCRV